ncbi:unnamed protein product [Cylindrotheca closterium]|uniref:Uncharacterized protein n=1 Tax=Cylindrotheca closterium TaxID=2856 RepID=A0AAD2CDE5_9STRA|nr:unnamed protein product [Cylindrotheca closterium]
MRIFYITLPLAVSCLAGNVNGAHINLVSHSNNPGTLGLCQGDCDIDEHCADGLICFQRDEFEEVQGCSGGEYDGSKTDYCAPETFPTSPTSVPMRQLPVPTVRTPTNAAPVAIAFNPTSFPALVVYGGNPPASLLPLGRCEGDCDVDDHCGPGLFCFQRGRNEPVPGCSGGAADNSRTDYCVPKAGFPRIPTPQELPSMPPTPSPSTATTAPSIAPEPTDEPTDEPTISTIPGPQALPSISPTPFPSTATASPSTAPEPTDEPTLSPTISAPTYSAPVSDLNPLPALISFGSDPPPFRMPLQLCQGDCDGDSDCQPGLICLQRGSNEPVNGCSGGIIDNSRTDYCVSGPNIATPSPSLSPVEAPTNTPSLSPVEDPTNPPSLSPVEDPTNLPSLSPAEDPTNPPSLSLVEDPTNPPILSPVGEPTFPPLPDLVSYGGDPPPAVYPLKLCEGDCDEDSDCQPGLICYQKDSFEVVPGCNGGLNDESEEDYCVQPVTPAVETYTPGKLTVQKLGLLLSEGLDARIIATTGERVRYHDGRESMETFHLNPDAGATFQDEREGNEGGWIYVSNSEVNDAQGGVGAITFDKDGNILEYKMLLKRSSMNCGGGRTPFDTWVTCEEVDAEGQLYQVDPTGKRSPQVLTLGKDGGRFESFAFDVRNRMIPHFFVTEDHEQGCLRRFTPLNPDWENDPWSMLHGDGKVDYLFLRPSETGEFGTYEWIDDLSRARSNAQKYYRFSEGIDVSGSELFYVCKESKHMFTLDLDRGTYTRQSTVNGLFDGTPDQIERVLEGSSEFLYFTEEGGRDAGVHARNADGSFFTVFESPVYPDETTGLSWSPDGRIMYVAYQFTGLLFSIWRQDGEPFHQTQLDVKFHHQV